jgi:hypothetical protein
VNALGRAASEPGEVGGGLVDVGAVRLVAGQQERPLLASLVRKLKEKRE